MIDRLAAEHIGYTTVKSAQLRTAGEIRHVKDTGPVERKNVAEHNYRASDLKKLTKILWHLSVCLGHLGTGTNLFTRVKSIHISPDGRLGGRGYDKAITDLRKELYDAIEKVSAAQDTLYDEISAPHWKPKIKDLSKEDQEDVEEMIGDVKEIRDDPEAYSDAAYEEEVEEDARKKKKKQPLPDPVESILPE
tara:strand:+ start:8273 stop:8848 length:576 start_codon:yes stop_codon:yes gene_type:complete